MKKFLDFIGENDMSIIFVSGLITFMIAFLMVVNRFTINEEEKECFNYYKENNYILENCKKYKDKY